MRHVLRILSETGKVYLVVVTTEGLRVLAIQIREIETELKSYRNDESQGPDLKVLGE